MPVETGLFHHFVVAPAVEDTARHHEEDDQVDDHPAEHVETVETGDEEEEVRVLGLAVFVVDRENKKILRTIPASEFSKLNAGEILQLTA